MKLIVVAVILCAGLILADEVTDTEHGYKAGFVSGYAKVMNEFHKQVDSSQIAMIETSMKLTPLFDEYGDHEPVSQNIRNSRQRHHRVHGANPEPQDVDLEADFLADYTKSSETQSGTRPLPRTAKPIILSSKEGPKTMASGTLSSTRFLQARETPTSTEATAAAVDEPETLEADPAVNGTAGDNTRRLREQEQRIKELEEKYSHAQSRLDHYETQQSAMGAGSGHTDSAGKTEFIKGYEGGFKVGYEAGWNMATADLKKRYGFPEKTGHVEESIQATNGTTNGTVAAVSNVAPTSMTPPAMNTATPAAPGTTGTTTQPPGLFGSTTNLFHNPQQPMAFNNPIAAENSPFRVENMPPFIKNSPFFAPQDDGNNNQAQAPQFQQQSQPQLLQQPIQQFLQPMVQQMEQPNMVPQMAMTQALPQMQFPSQAANQGLFSQFMPQQDQAQVAPQGLPQKAFQFLSNIKNMIQEGKNTVDAVRMALQGDPSQQQQQFSQNMFAQAPQQQFMQPVNQFAPQGQNFGFQNLIQTQPATLNQNQQGNSLLSSLAALLGGTAANPAAPTAFTSSPPTANSPASPEALGLTNLAQLLATTTGTASSALPKPVQALPNADSATIGLQEMQNMIQEGQEPVS